MAAPRRAGEIEKPENPLAFRFEETFTSIGKFYQAIHDALDNEQPVLVPAGQLVNEIIDVKVLEDRSATWARSRRSHGS